MKKLLFIAIALLTLTSYASIEAITLANGNAYVNFDAYVAYDVYNGFYENNLIEDKPVLINKKE